MPRRRERRAAGTQTGNSIEGCGDWNAPHAAQRAGGQGRWGGRRRAGTQTGNSIQRCGDWNSRTSDPLELARRAGMVVQTRRARSEVVVHVWSACWRWNRLCVSAWSPHSFPRGVRCGSGGRGEGHTCCFFVSIHCCRGPGHRRGRDSVSATGGTSAVGATAAARPPRASKKGSKRVAQPPQTPLSSGVYVAADMSAWRRPLTFANTVDTDTAIVAEARRIGHFLRSHSKGSDKLAIQQAVYMVRCVSLASPRDSPARPLLWCANCWRRWWW